MQTLRSLRRGVKFLLVRTLRKPSPGGRRLPELLQDGLGPVVDGLVVEFFQRSVFGAKEQGGRFIFDGIIVNVGAINEWYGYRALRDGFAIA